MPWRGPTYDGEFPSLGWAVCDLIAECLRVPSGQGYGGPLVLTPEQVSFVVRLYRIDGQGRPVYRRGVLERAKGWGKSPLLGALTFAELVGPVVFDGWDIDGEPVGRPQPTPWVQIAAVSEDQTDNTYMQLRDALAESAAIDEFGIDLGLTRIFLKDRPGRIEPVTSSAGAREGQPVTFAVLDETHLWTPSNGGARLAATVRRNVAKMNGRSVESTNAYRKGEESVAEDSAKAAERKAAGLLHDTRRGRFVDDLADRVVLRRALEAAYGDASWVDLGRIAEECNDPATRPSDARRFYLNIPAEEIEDESWLPDGCWEAHRRPGARIDVTLPFWAAVDMALKHDTTALRIVQPLDDDIVTEAVTWVPDGMTLDVQAIENEIRRWHATGSLVECAYDPAYFERSAQVLVDDGVNMVEFPQSAARMVPACGHAYGLIVGSQVWHDDEPVAADQVQSAVPRTAGEGWRLSKGKSRRKIDSAIALVMALDRATRQAEKAPTPFFIAV